MRSPQDPLRPPREDDLIRAAAAAQHGIVSRRQLLRAGVSRHVVAYRLRTGALRRLRRGVYQVGPLLVRRAPEMTAALACGGAGVISHFSAAALHDMLPDHARDGEAVDVLFAGAGRPPRDGIRTRRTRRLDGDEITRSDGIPVTTPARTLLDLAGVADRRSVEQALARAERARLVTTAQLHALLERHPRHRGARALRALIEGGPAAFTRSKLEMRFLELQRRAGLPAPQTNVRVRGFEVDCYWPAADLVVELDGFAYHSKDPDFETDRRRDRALAAAGITVIRITWRAMQHESERLLVELTRALTRGGSAVRWP